MNTFLFIAVYIFALLAMIITALLFVQKRGNKLVLAGIGVFASLFALFLPADSGQGITNAFTQIVIALFRSVRVFGLGEDLLTAELEFGDLPLWFATLYVGLLDLLYLLAPLLTFSLILSAFNNISSTVRLTFSIPREIYIFSERNMRAEIVAENVQRKSPRAVIVFFNSEKSALDENEKALCFNKNVLKINRFVLNHARHITFYICSDDKNDNIRITAELLKIVGENSRLVCKLKRNKRGDCGIDLFYFYSKRRSLPILSGVDKCGVRVRRVNEIQNVVYNLIYDEPVLKYVNKETGIVNIAVVGAGKYGEEFIKAAVWSGQHQNYKLNINVFDKQPVKELFTRRYPELANTEKLSDSKDINYKINFFDEKDFREMMLEDIEEMKSLDYALVALGNDDDNIEAALYLRECTARMNDKPKIFTIVTDVGLTNTELLSDLKNHKGERFDISFILPEDVFSYEKTIELEKRGMKMYKMWKKLGIIRNQEENKEKDISELIDSEFRKSVLSDETYDPEFYDSEFDYWSSIASVMFWSVRKSLGEDIQESNENMLLEHQRWSAYRRSEGYRYAENRNDMAQQHNCLKAYELIADDIKLNDGISISFANTIDNDE